MEWIVAGCGAVLTLAAVCIARKETGLEPSDRKKWLAALLLAGVGGFASGFLLILRVGTYLPNLLRLLLLGAFLAAAAYTDAQKHRNQYDVIKINMQEFLSATSGIDEMLRMLNDYLIFDLREQYSQVRFRDEKNLVQVMKDLTYDNEKENVSIPNREVSQEYINAISRFPFCNTTMKTRCGRIFLSLFSVPACSV